MTRRGAALVSATVAAAYGFAFVLRSSYRLGGHTWFVLLDDAMISMKYAQTFVRGDGLVWFPGADHVQGFTDPLWALLMAFVQLPPWPPWLVSLPMQLTGVACVAVAAVGAVLLYAAICSNSRQAWVAGLCVALYFPLHYWSDLGMEAGATTALLVCAALATLRWYREGGWLWSAALFVIGTWTRLDFAIYAGPAALGALLAWRHGGVRFRDFVRWAAIIAGAAAAVLVAQRLYYGDWLPNTAALKLGVPATMRFARGWTTAGDFVRHLGWPVVVLAIAGIVTASQLRMPGRVLLGGAIVAAIAYDVWVGGDAWEAETNTNRFLLPVVPLLFVLASAPLARLRARPLLETIAVSCILIAAIFRSNAGALDDGDRVRLRMRQLALLASTSIREDHDWKMLKAGVFLRAALKPGARPTIAVSSAGIAPFLVEQARYVDLLGLSDRHIAHLPPKERPFLPGHMKWDLAYSVGALHPDMAIGNWDGSVGTAMGPDTVELPAQAGILVRPQALGMLKRPVALLALYRHLDFGPAELAQANLERALAGRHPGSPAPGSATP